MKLQSVSRLLFFKFAIVLVALILGGKLFLVQVVHGNDYKQRADRQYVTPTLGTFNRGAIYFKDKTGNLISAATLRVGYTLAIDPRQVTDASTTYAKLSSTVALNEDDFLRRASKKNDPYEELLHRLSKEQADAIKVLRIPAVRLVAEKWRYYPAGSLASHILGFVGYDGNILRGRYGVEKYQDDILSRKNKQLYVNFFAEVFSDIKETLSTKYENNRDGDVILTIEPSVQEFVEKELKTLREKWDGVEVGGIIMDPRNGAIYAMANNPDFDPNMYNEVTDPAVFINPSTERVYEMGSIIKPLTMATGIDSGVITKETTYDDKGYVVLDRKTIRNYDGRGRGVVPMQQVLSQSLNTGAVYIERKVGNERFRKYFNSFGIGKKTGIDLPNEAPGLAHNLYSKRDVEYATASFGQGIAMTPIATIRALAVLANGGKLVTPHITDGIKYELGLDYQTNASPGVQVIKPSTAKTVTSMLITVVDEALVRGKVKLDRYTIAAKTGTAQIASPDGGYYDDRYLHSFFGYFPATNPRFIVFLYIKDPKGVRYASHTLTYPFMDIAKFLLSYYEIPPDR